LHIPAERVNSDHTAKAGLGSDPDFSQFPNDFVLPKPHFPKAGRKYIGCAPSGTDCVWIKLFANRTEAGRRLAEKLTTYANRVGVIVLALPRGGVPVGYEVAHALGLPFDVFIVRKLGMPGHEELAMGAIASGGVRVLNDEVVWRVAQPPTLQSEWRPIAGATNWSAGSSNTETVDPRPSCVAER
jgi:hypothetical protein